MCRTTPLRLVLLKKWNSRTESTEANTNSLLCTSGSEMGLLMVANSSPIHSLKTLLKCVKDHEIKPETREEEQEQEDYLSTLHHRVNLIGAAGAEESLGGVLAQCTALTHLDRRGNLVGAVRAVTLEYIEYTLKLSYINCRRQERKDSLKRRKED